MQSRSLGQEDIWEEGMATRSSILVWRIPWTEEPGRLQSTLLQKVRQDWSDLAHTSLTFQSNPPSNPSLPGPKCGNSLQREEQGWIKPFLCLFVKTSSQGIPLSLSAGKRWNHVFWTSQCTAYQADPLWFEGRTWPAPWGHGTHPAQEHVENNFQAVVLYSSRLREFLKLPKQHLKGALSSFSLIIMKQPWPTGGLSVAWPVLFLQPSFPVHPPGPGPLEYAAACYILHPSCYTICLFIVQFSTLECKLHTVEMCCSLLLRLQNPEACT